jgi:flagellin-like protein
MNRLLPATPSSDYLSKNNNAVSPVIGAILLILLTILLAGITASVVYGKDYSTSLKPAPMAVIEVESVVGGVPDRVRYEENFIVLTHRGGDSLQTDSTKILINGEGSSYTGAVTRGGVKRYGNLLAVYEDLEYEGKIPLYKKRNVDLSDGVWSAGEKLVLNGYDSINGTTASSVLVSINGMSNTSNNYGLKQNTIITIKVFDRESNKIIAEMKHKVTPAK